MESSEQRYEHKYGLVTNVPMTEVMVELYMLRQKLYGAEHGLSSWEHFQNARKLFWPKLSANPWLDSQHQSLCSYHHVGWAGCGASGKTFAATMWAMIWWACDPLNSVVVLTSTTAKMIRKRMWANLQELFRTSAGFPGYMVDSKMTLQAVKGDDKHSISAIAVAEGSTSKAVANIQGIHGKRVMVIIDEATDTPEAAYEACTNLNKGTSDFRILVIGNPASKYDPHGRFCEPLDGWNTVGIDDDEWETKNGGVCLRFDGEKSPNILAGKEKWPFLFGEKDLIKARREEGDESPTYWKYTRGFWAPDGMVKTVLSESLCQRHKLNRKITFENDVSMLAGLDPGFGGDRCVLRFSRLGKSTEDQNCLMFDDTVNIKISAASDEPIHYQIANQVIRECQDRGVKHQHLAIDTTGEGGGLADIIAHKWGNPHRVEFGGSPSQLPVSEEDARQADDVYDRRVTELWFSIRKWAMQDRIGGLDFDTLKELCSRLFSDEKRKIVIEPKSEMKKRTKRSPDLADAVAVTLDLARTLISGNNRNSRVDKQWSDLVKQFDSVYDPQNMYVETA